MRFFILLMASLFTSFSLYADDSHRDPTLNHYAAPERTIIERKMESKILVEFDQLNSNGNFFSGICKELGEENIIGIQVLAPYTGVKKSTDALIEDLKKENLLHGAKAFKVSRIYIAPAFRSNDGSYNGAGPETVCLRVEGEQKGINICKALKKSIDSFKFGLKYSGCLSSEGREFMYNREYLAGLQQKATPHRKDSDFANAIVHYEKGRFEEAKKLVEEMGYSQYGLGDAGFFSILTGVDTQEAFNKIKTKLLQAPNSPVISIEPNVRISIIR